MTVAELIDLRTDTVTRPTPGMREAMAAAEVGDDVYGEDPTNTALEAEVAALFGHEAALFAPSGSMANQIALQLHVPPGDELLCDADAHVVTYEVGAAAAYGGISSRTWPAVGADLGPDVVAGMIRPDGCFAVPTRAIA
ncbi:low-specificity L-threonine aldolase, partial [Micromonospora sp. M42]